MDTKLINRVKAIQMKKKLANQTKSDNITVTEFNTESEKDYDPYHSTNSNSEFDVKNEDDLKESPILYYASKVLAKNYKKDQDLVLTIRNGIDQKEYVYNQKNNTLRRHDSFGIKYYNKNDEETKREKFLLIYELKKLYLEKEEREYTQKLQKGEFYDDNLVVEDNSSQKKFLEEQIKYIDKVIDILNEQNPNYGRSFGEQINSFIKTLNDLKNFSCELDKAEWDEQVVKFINESFLKNRQLSESSEDKYVIDLDGNKKKQCQLIIKCINLVQSKDFKIENIEQLKNSQEYSDLNKARSEEFFGGLIRDNIRY
jgi:hypothetical protein